MEKTLKEFQNLRIPLSEIRSATNNFNVDSIGGGGFGKVYKGEVCHSKGRSVVAIKRLDPRRGQGKPEFLTEIMSLSRYTHKNLIDLLGFCYEENEMILVYEYASRESLARHLNSPHLTWERRLKICLDAAMGLCYLHDPGGTHQRLIHRDVKSDNILLDGQWNAKVADFGLSIMGPANEQHSVVVANTAGTPVYCDPQYERTQTLTKESDVYSFGVVLFEVLCGRLCCVYKNGRVEKDFVPTWIESYKQKKLNDIIFKDPTIPSLDQSALESFSDIAYSCLSESREDRPKMADVVARLDITLDYQKISEGKPLFDYEDMIKTIEPPLNYKSKDELVHQLKKGVILNNGKTWFSLNKKEEHCEMISFRQCLDADPSDSFIPEPYEYSDYESRFAVGLYKYSRKGRIKACVKPQFLSPGITYMVNFVFNFLSYDHQHMIGLKYKLPGETKPSVAYLADRREDGWLMCELYQFTSDRKTIDLEILFEGFSAFNELAVEGIEFQPMEKAEFNDETQPISDSEAEYNDETQPISDSDANLPPDYEDLMKLLKKSVQWATRKEAYSIIRKGFLIGDGQKWFSLNKNGKKCRWFSIDKNGKKCLMLSARAVQKKVSEYMMLSLPESRFGEAFRCEGSLFDINAEIQSQLLSPQTTYATYLVYKLPGDQSRFGGPMGVKINESIEFIYLLSPQNPVVIRTKADQNTQKPLNRPGLPRQRNDGWMEVQLYEFSTTNPPEMIPMHVSLCHYGDMKLWGVIIEGVELRTI